MDKVDCLGEMCPIPFLKFKDYLENKKNFIIVVDHSCAKDRIEKFCKNNNIKYSIIEVLNGVWEIEILTYGI